MDFNTLRKRHQMTSVEFDQKDSKELPQFINCNEVESPIKKRKCDETLDEPSDANENCSVENNLNLDVYDSPPTPSLFDFEPSGGYSQEDNPTNLAMDTDTQSTCASRVLKNKASEKASKKMSFSTNFYFNPCDYVDDPNERKLTDLRSNRADPVDYVAMFPRKGEKRTEECRKFYSSRMLKNFDSIQDAIFRDQRKSLTYLKWAPPIDIPVEDRFSSLSLTARNAKRSFTVSNVEEVHINDIDDNFEDEDSGKTFKGQAKQSQVSKAGYKVQVDEDSDGFLPYQNKRRSNRKKNRGGQQKIANKNPNARSQPLSRRLSINKSNQEKKVVNLDSDEDACTFNSSEINVIKDRNVPKTHSRGQSNRGGTSGSLLNRSDVGNISVKEGISPISKANFKLQISDDEEFTTVQNQKRKTGTKNKVPFRPLIQGRKIDICNYPDCNNDFPELSSRTQKNCPTANSRNPANRDEASKSFRASSSVQDEETEEMSDPVVSYPCPMCENLYPSSLIDDHAFDCQGNSDTKCAAGFKRDNENNLECVVQNDVTFERPVQNVEVSSREMMNSRISSGSISETELLASINLKQLKVMLLDLSKDKTNVRENPVECKIETRASNRKKF